MEQQSSKNRSGILLVVLGLFIAGLFGSCIVWTKKSKRALAESFLEARAESQALAKEPSIPAGAVRTGSHYEWKIVGRSTIGRTVYMEPAAYDDFCFFADTFFRVKETAFEGRTLRIHFYDDLAATPSKLKVSQSDHRRAAYAYNGGNGTERFEWVLPGKNPGDPPRAKRAGVPLRCP